MLLILEPGLAIETGAFGHWNAPSGIIPVRLIHILLVKRFEVYISLTEFARFRPDLLAEIMVLGGNIKPQIEPCPEAFYKPSMNQQPTTFLTGATGFVGASVARVLINKGHRMRALARPNNDRRNLDGLDIEIIEGDLGKPESYRHALKGCRALCSMSRRITASGFPIPPPCIASMLTARML